MNNFSGIIYRIWGVCGVMMLLGIVCILFGTPWLQKGWLQRCKFGLLTIAFAVCLSTIYASRIFFPNVLSYTGEFVDTHRNSRVAPPLPLTNEYVFWNGEGKRKVFYLDVLSKEEIYPFEFETGEQYTVYYDSFTKVITRVETVFKA